MEEGEGRSAVFSELRMIKNYDEIRYKLLL